MKQIIYNCIVRPERKFLFNAKYKPSTFKAITRTHKDGEPIAPVIKASLLTGAVPILPAEPA